jgi:shikimate dehydrogenase
MKHYGLIGFPLSHSFSKKYFTEKFEKENITDSVTNLYPLENIEDLAKLLHENPNCVALTLPFRTR